MNSEQRKFKKVIKARQRRKKYLRRIRLQKLGIEVAAPMSRKFKIRVDKVEEKVIPKPKVKVEAKPKAKLNIFQKAWESIKRRLKKT